MYKLDELEIQNLQDSWSAMYVIIARSIMDILGRAGEGVLRESIRRFGRDEGLSVNRYHQNNNIKINLENFFTVRCRCLEDPRFRANIQCFDEQVRLMDVITCPMADLWNRYGENDIGRFYCEEFYHACFGAYCYDRVKVNISKTLTQDRDNHCRFALYFRPANLPEELRSKCFREFDPDYKLPEAFGVRCADAKQSFTSLWLKMYYYMLEVAGERYGMEGQCAVALGLRKLALDAAAFMKKRADMTGNTFDAPYVSANYPIDVDIDRDPFWEEYDKHDAREILKINFNHVFKEQLGF